MPIYLSGGINQGGEPTEEFKDRGLYGSGPAKVEESSVFGFVTTTIGIGFLGLVSYIQWFAAMTWDSTATIANSGFKKVVHYVTEIPVEAPILFLSINAARSEEEKLLGMGLTKSPESNKGVWIGRPDLANVRKIREEFHPPDYGYTPAGNVNLAGYVAFTYCWQTVGIFMTVIGLRSSYASINQWKYTAEGVEEYGAMVDKTSGLGFAEADKDTEFVECKDGDMGTTQIFTGEKLKMVIEPVACVGETGFNNFVHGLDYEVPSGGHLFPYFKGLLTPSLDFITSVIFRYFSKCLTDSPDAAAQLFPFLRIGLRSLSRTNQGLELQHIFFGIQLAIECGARMRIFVDHGIYYGFCLLGTMTIIDHARVKESLSMSELRKEIKALNVHLFACIAIKEMLEGMIGPDGKIPIIDMELLKNSSRYLNQVVVDAIGRVEEVPMSLEGEIRKLRYGNKYWPINEENIFIVIQAMTTGIWQFPSAPFCLDGNLYKASSNLVRALAVFGPTAPSIIAGSNKFFITKPGKNDPNLIVADKKRRLPYIPIYRKSVQQAAIEWNIIRDKKTLSMIGPKKGAEKSFTDRSKAYCFVGERFDEIYAAIRTFAYAFDVEDAKTGKKKRLLEQEGATAVVGGEGTSNKKERKDRATAEDFF